MAGDRFWSGLLLFVAGVWLLLQTLVGDLPRRIISWQAGGWASKAGPQAPGAPGGNSGLGPTPGQPPPGSGSGGGGGGGGSW
jgi:hypothetical protein